MHPVSPPYTSRRRPPATYKRYPCSSPAAYAFRSATHPLHTLPLTPPRNARIFDKYIKKALAFAKIICYTHSRDK